MLVLISTDCFAASVHVWDGRNFTLVLSRSSQRQAADEAAAARPCVNGIDAALRERYLPFVRLHASKNNLPLSVVEAVIMCESAYVEDALSHAGAYGLMQ